MIGRIIVAAPIQVPETKKISPIFLFIYSTFLVAEIIACIDAFSISRI